MISHWGSAGFYKHFYSEGQEEIWEILEESGRKQEEWERKTGPAGTGLEIGRHESRIFPVQSLPALFFGARRRRLRRHRDTR